MTTQHTPGPWHFAPVVQDNKAFTPVFVGCEVRDENGKLIVYLPAKKPGVTVSSGDSKTIEIAMLIAAAPDLLKALKDCREALRRIGATGELAVVDAAITKATGADHASR